MKAMRASGAFRVTSVAVVGLNLGILAAGLLLPAHDEWLYYVELEIPADVAMANGPDDVATRLAIAGYTVRRDDWGRGPVLVATRADAPGLQAWLRGLGGGRGPSITVDIRCTVHYILQDCRGQPELRLRTELAAVVGASGLPVNPAGGQFDDYDFANIGEAFLFMGQLMVALVSAIVIVVALRRPRGGAVVWLWPPS